jgi:hypothetical protein
MNGRVEGFPDIPCLFQAMAGEGVEQEFAGHIHADHEIFAVVAARRMGEGEVKVVQGGQDVRKDVFPRIADDFFLFARQTLARVIQFGQGAQAVLFGLFTMGTPGRFRRLVVRVFQTAFRQFQLRPLLRQFQFRLRRQFQFQPLRRPQA